MSTITIIYLGMGKTIFLNLQEHEELKKLLEENKYSSRMIKKLHVLRLADKGYSSIYISKVLEMEIQRVYKYLKIYKIGGILALITEEKPGNQSILTEEILQKLEQYINDCQREKKKCTYLHMKVFLDSECKVNIGKSWLARTLQNRRFNSQIISKDLNNGYLGTIPSVD